MQRLSSNPIIRYVANNFPCWGSARTPQDEGYELISLEAVVVHRVPLDDESVNEENTSPVVPSNATLAEMLRAYGSIMFSSNASYGYTFLAAFLTLGSAISNYGAAFALSTLFEEVSKYAKDSENNTTSFEGDSKIYWMISSVVLMLLVAQLLPSLRELVLAPLSAHTTKNLMIKVTEHQLNQPLGNYFSESQGDRDNVRQKVFPVGSMGAPILTIASESVQSAVTIGVFSRLYGWPVGVGMTVMLAVYTAYCAMTAKVVLESRETMMKRWNEAWRLMARVTTRAQYEVMHDFGQGARTMLEVREKAQIAAVAEIKAVSTPALVSLGYAAIPRIGMLSMLLYAGVKLQKNQLTTSEFVAFLGYLNQLSISLPSVGQAMSQLFTSYPNFAFVMSKLIEKNKQNMRTQGNVNRSGKIEIDHVSFTYPGKPALFNDISLTIEAGQTVALVSPSGGGKSSIFSLLMQYYELDPGKGKVMIGGVDISTVDADVLRENVRLVRQDPNLSAGSVISNIMYGVKRNDADGIMMLPSDTPLEIKQRDDKLVELAMDLDFFALAKKLNLAEFICSLSEGKETKVEVTRETFIEGLKTDVGEDGKGISGGQQKKVAILRALFPIYLEKPPILLLDEITAHLDKASANDVLAGIKNLTKDMFLTVVMITHHLEETLHADKLFVIDKGCVVAEGTHADLLATCPLYVDIWEMNQPGDKNKISVAANMTLGFIKKPSKEVSTDVEKNENYPRKGMED